MPRLCKDCDNYCTRYRTGKGKTKPKGRFGVCTVTEILMNPLLNAEGCGYFKDKVVPEVRRIYG